MIDEKIEDVYSLSPMQLGILFHTLYSEEPGAYLDQQVYALQGDLNVSAFERAWQCLIERHPILRTSFHWEGLPDPLQIVHGAVDLHLDRRDWRSLSAAEQQAELELLLKAHRIEGIDISEAPLMCLTLIQVSADGWQFAWTVHHLLLDRWSIAQLLSELSVVYETLVRGLHIELPRSRPYGDYIGWLQEQDPRKAEAYWRRTLAGFKTPTVLPVDRAPGSQTVKGPSGREVVRFSVEVTSSLKSLARQHHLTLNTLVQGAWALLLSRYSGEEDVLFGAALLGRPASLSGVERMVGLFINTLPVRVRVKSSARLIDWLHELQNAASELREYEYSSLLEIQSWSEVPRGTPLFESLVIVQNTPVPEPARAAEQTRADSATLKFRSVASESTVDFPLLLQATLGRQLSLWLNYNVQRYDTADVTRMLDHFQVLLESIVDDPTQRLSQLPLLTQAEKRQLAEFNNTFRDYDLLGGVHELIEEQVERTPHALALMFEDQQLTYRELNVRANRLAHFLRGEGVAEDVLVGLHLQRSVEMVVCILAVLKAGGAYVPFDPSYPSERVGFMLEDAQVPLLLTQHALQHTLPHTSARVLVIEEVEEGALCQPQEDPKSGVGGESLAYMIYTSGSTGQPKGALNTHRGIRNRLLWMQEEYALNASDRVLQKTPFSFDVSVWEFLWPLLSGACLVLARPEGHKDPSYLVELIVSTSITTLHFVPSMLRVFLEAEDVQECARSLRRVICSGEALGVDLVPRFFSGLGGVALHNLYGPTEAAVDVTYYACLPGVSLSSVPIGRAIANTQIHILDVHGRQVPIGVAGELYIGGVNVGRGYHNRAQLSGEKFVLDPFRGDATARMYRTGDLCRYLSDGNIEYLGRLDHQVKIRGFRIELGEIESVLLSHASVRDAVVVAREDTPGDKRLVAYLSVDLASAPSVSALREHLLVSLPEYMLPSAFVMLETLPLSPNGKVDRKALPAPDLQATEEGYVAPRTPVEEGLCEIWGEILRIEQVGVRDSFFELGGHSLLATQVMSRVRSTFQVHLPLRTLFDAPTVTALAQHIAAAQREEEVAAIPPLERVSRENPLPLSFSQQRLWFLNQYEPESAVYNIPMALSLLGTLDLAALQRSLSELLQRHEALRTTFASVQDTPVQVVWDARPLAVQLVDLGALGREERAAEAHRLLQEEYQRPFELQEGPLFRATLLRLADEEHVLVLTLHHIVSDGWSMGILRQELATLYNAFRAGRPSPLQPLSIQYADYAAWQRQWLQGESLERQIAYWKDRLTGAPTLLELPTDRPRPPVRTFRGAIRRRALSEELTAELKALGQQEGVTLFMTLLAAFQLLLSRYSGQEDIVVGTPIAGRTRAEVEGLIGLFLNTLALRTDLSGNPTFRELLAQVRESALGAYAHQDLPFERLVEELTSERSLSHSPLFQVLFTFQNAPRGALDLDGMHIEALRSEGVTAKFDLSLAMGPSGNGLGVALEYNTDLFDADRIERMLGHFEMLLRGIVADPEQRIGAVPLLTPDERRQLVVEWNETGCSFPDRRLHQLFEDQADRWPDAPALRFEGASFSYTELEACANRVAHELSSYGIGEGSYVGVALERSFELLVALLGVLKAGAAYIPIDLSYPPARIASMLQQARVGAIVSREAEAARLPEHAAPLLCLDRDAERLASRSSLRLNLGIDPQSPAYVIYTSGSTGVPKGVVVSHRAILNHMEWMQDQFPLTPQDRVLLKTPISFDASVWECWGALMAGAELVVARPGGHSDPAYLVDLIRSQRITTVKLVPSLLQMLLEEQGFGQSGSLRQIFCGAEALPADLQQRFFAEFGERVALHNLYGPTEAAIDATGFTCRADWGRSVVPIGRPISNVRAYVLDRRLNPAPTGVPGELYLGGASLALGYLNGPDLTAERFVPDPFGAVSGDRLYRTGDRVRYLPDGNIEYLGRLDHQVKVRGFRIELGEIESVLQQHPHVREAVLLAREDTPGDTRLVAYVVGSGEVVSTADALREHLLERLPSYMLPAAFVMLPALPLTASGKVDRKALPVPDCSITQESASVPRTPIEEGITAIWREVLRRQEVSLTDSFFEMGGHSLLATQVISRVRATFQVDIALRALFETPTIAGLAQQIETLRRDGMGLLVPPLERASREMDLPLSFSQQRLWFVDQLQPGSALYNVPTALRMRGSLDLTALHRALEEIFRRHEVLRTRYGVKGGYPVQVISEETHFALPLLDLSGLPERQREEEARQHAREEALRPFDLSVDPMMRAMALRLGSEDHVLLLTLHHIASDGWSRGILMRELSALYNAFAAGEPSPLPPLPIQYADYAVWQRGWLQGEALEHEVDYWKGRLSGAPAVLELPTDRPREEASSYSGAMHRFAAPAELSEGLRRLCRAERATPFMVLLAAFKVLLYRWTGQSDLVVGTDVANRTEPQTEGLIGFFLNHLVLRTEVSGDPSFRELLGRVREVCLGAYAHQDLPFDKLVEVLQPQRQASHTPVFQVLFVVQNVPRGATEWSGLTLESGGELTSSKFDLSLFLGESGEGLGGAWVYRTDLFDTESVRHLSTRYLDVLGQVLRNPDMAIEDVELVSEQDVQKAQSRPHGIVGSVARSRTAGRRTAVIIEAGEAS